MRIAKSTKTVYGLLLSGGLVFLSPSLAADDPWVVYEGGAGPGAGKHIVLVSGDDEYRSEEALPQLGKILSVRHGFKCTVLFAIDPSSGEIKPNYQNNIPGLEALATADMMVLGLRFRELPDDKMKYFADFTNSGKPILGLRTSTHAFHIKNKESAYAKWDFRSEEWPGGWGQQVLGDTWVNHHGHHGKESTRGIINHLHGDHPIVRGAHDIWGDTDVYGISHLPSDADVLVYGQVLVGMSPDDRPNHKKPLMPVVWVRSYTGTSGKPARIIATTMGAATDLRSEGLRRILVNACYWGLGLEDWIAPESQVDLVGDYQPTTFGFGTFKKGVKPAAHALR